MATSVFIVIPCFDAATKIAGVVQGALRTGLPVLVVDDGSVDGSGAIAAAAGAEVVRHPLNQGKGAALRTGFRHALLRGGEAVLTLDADGQHDPDDIPALLAAHEHATSALIIGVRSFAPDDMPTRSRIGNRISTFWIARFAGRHFSDTQSGFRLYPKALLGLKSMRTHRFDTEAELLLSAAKMGLDLVEVPVRTIYDADRVTHFHALKDTLRVMRLVFFSPIWGLKLRSERK